MIKTIGMLNLFGEEIGLRSDQNTIALGLSYAINKKYLESITMILDSLNAENIVNIAVTITNSISENPLLFLLSLFRLTFLLDRSF